MPRLFGSKRTRNSSDDPEEFRASLGEHLEELRARLIRIVVLISVGMVVGWYLQPIVYERLAEVVRDLIPPTIEFKETFRTVTDPFMLKLKVAFVIGLTLVFPFVVLQLWGFVAPGLKPNERKPLTVVGPISVLLFALGGVLCWAIIPSAFAWFISYIEEFPNTAVYQEPGTLVFFILKMILAFGIGFQLPLVVYFLTKVGLLSSDTLKAHWRQATVIIFFGAAVLTPSSDVFSMLMMAVPMTVLFFASMAAVRLSDRKSDQALDAVLDDES